MTKDELIQKTAISLQCSPNQVEVIMDAIIDTLIGTVLYGERRIDLRNDFGSFVIRWKGPASQDSHCSQKVISFKATPTLKKKLR